MSPPRTVVYGLDPEPLLRLVPGSTREQARLMGVSDRSVCRWRSGFHGVHPKVADEVAVRLGFHPAEVWGDDWWAAS